MVKKVLMILVVIMLTITSLCIYGVYRFFNRFGGEVSKEKSDSYYYNTSKDGIIYSPMGNWFELGEHKMEVDLSTFEVLGRDYAKDKNYAYYKSRSIDLDVDISSFEIKNEYVPIDKNHVYILIDNYYHLNLSRKGFEILKDADPLTYQQLDYNFSRDKNFVFQNNIKLEGIKTDSFQVLNDSFCKDSSSVYTYLYQKQIKPLKTNVSEVKSLTQKSILDDKFVYIHLDYKEGELIDSVISIPYKNVEKIKVFENNLYFKIDNHIYYEAVLIREADANTFEEIRNGYAKDANHIFFNGHIVEGADVLTFSYSTSSYSFSEKNYKYLAGKRMK